jgi:hypothetical protein
LIGGREYQLGLFYGIEPIDVYDPLEYLTRLGQMPSDGQDQGYGGRGFPGVSLLVSGDVLIFGGLSSQLVEDRKPNGQVKFLSKGASNTPRSSTLEFDPQTGDFRRVGNLNIPRWGPLASSWIGCGCAFAIGGAPTAPSRQPLPQAEVYDPPSETWSFLPPEPEPTSPDDSPRMGVRLSDGTVLTWSSSGFAETSEIRTVKRLFPMGAPG